jgi:hypothetical protein
MFDPRVHMDLSKSDIEKLDELKRLEEVPWFIEVTKLLPGDSFGELALINKEPRSASIKCICNCYFATLGKSDYLKVLRKIEMREVEEKVLFFYKLPLMEGLSRT